MTDTHLIVPIDVAALAVGTADSAGPSFLAPTADFSQLPGFANGRAHHPGPYTSAAVLADGAPFEGATSLPAGIHLHWALPAGVTTGSAEAGGLQFPSAPDRWLVTRVVVTSPASGGSSTGVTSWVVESDALSPVATAPAGLPQPTVPLAPAPGGQGYAFIGESFALAGWSERESVPRLRPLTAVGYGHPVFAASYPDCSTVFGFYDALDLADYDAATSTVSYQVSGWYSDPTCDPLRQPGVTPASYGWVVPDDAAPTDTVCSGVVDAIAWDPATQYLSQPPGPLTVAIGPSAQEAMSALLADALRQSDPGEFADAEQVLNALQFGMLSGSTNEISALSTFEQDVHGAGFAALSGGRLWTVSSAAGDASDGGEVPLPDDLAEALNALNVAQFQADAATATLESLQFRLFADWYKYQILEHAANEAPPQLQNAQQAAQQYLANTALPAISDLRTQIGELTSRVTRLATALGAQLTTGHLLTDDVGAPRFYQPTDPVVVVSGPDVTTSDRSGSGSGTMACRTDSGIVTTVALAADLVPGSAAATVDATSLPALAAEPFPLAQALFGEAFLLAAGAQPAVTASLAARGGAGNPATLDPGAVTSALRSAASAFLGGTTTGRVTYTGLTPAPPYHHPWTTTPWSPIVLQYRVQFAPVQFVDPDAGDVYASTVIDDLFAWDPAGIDLDFGGPAPVRQQAYVGSAILTPDATVDLGSQISDFVANHGADPELAAVLHDLASLPVLAQGLTGLTDAFLMRGATLQLPVADPLTPPPLTDFVADVAAAVDGNNRAAPLPQESFNPIRSGLLTLDGLRLVDGFGRHHDYESPTVVVARGFTSRLSDAAPAAAFLPPRLAQPARLLFRWRAADDADVETNASPATSPVLGWVVPSDVDDAVQIYAADGTALGGLTLSADARTVLWNPAPGGVHPPGTPLASVFADQPADLAAFAEGVYHDGDASFFAPFVGAVREALAFSLPDQFAESAQQAVLAGQPLVLARASLALELAGPAATDESWTGFGNVVLNGATPSDAGVGAVHFPVTLGGPDQLDDTLVGYWLAPASADDFRVFWSSAATQSAGGVAPPDQTTVTLTPGGGATTDVVLLLDPRGSVHASTGVLPVKQIDIPSVFYTNSLTSLKIALEVAPVLSGSSLPSEPTAGPMTMVMPKVVDGEWSWVTPAADAWATSVVSDAGVDHATLAYTPQRLSEGWLVLTPLTPLTPPTDAL